MPVRMRIVYRRIVHVELCFVNSISPYALIVSPPRLLVQ